MKDSLIRKLKGMATTANMLHKTKYSYALCTYQDARRKNKEKNRRILYQRCVAKDSSAKDRLSDWKY